MNELNWISATFEGLDNELGDEPLDEDDEANGDKDGGDVSSSIRSISELDKIMSRKLRT